LFSETTITISIPIILWVRHILFAMVSPYHLSIILLNWHQLDKYIFLHSTTKDGLNRIVHSFSCWLSLDSRYGMKFLVVWTSSSRVSLIFCTGHLGGVSYENESLQCWFLWFDCNTECCRCDKIDDDEKMVEDLTKYWLSLAGDRLAVGSLMDHRRFGAIGGVCQRH
jgi:hypothetical protein